MKKIGDTYFGAFNNNNNFFVRSDPALPYSRKISPKLENSLRFPFNYTIPIVSRVFKRVSFLGYPPHLKMRPSFSMT
jgi:hypothetical protein